MMYATKCSKNRSTWFTSSQLSSTEGGDLTMWPWIWRSAATSRRERPEGISLEVFFTQKPRGSNAQRPHFETTKNYQNKNNVKQNQRSQRTNTSKNQQSPINMMAVFVCQSKYCRASSEVRQVLFWLFEADESCKPSRVFTWLEQQAGMPITSSTILYLSIFKHQLKHIGGWGGPSRPTNQIKPR